jgi:hypothetical protein
VEQQGEKLEVWLSGADLIQFNNRGDHFTGVVDREGRITFVLGDFYYSWYYGLSGNFGLVERLDAMSALAVAGTVDATSTNAGIRGALRGWVAVTRGVSGPFVDFSTTCFVDEQRFEMRRQ